MRPLVAFGFAVALVLALCAGPLGAALAAEPSRELIVRFDSDATAAGRLNARDAARTDFESSLPVQGMQLVEVDPGQPVAVAEQALESDADVLYAEPNAIRHASLVPNDPYFSQLWGLLNTGQSIRDVAGTPDADADVTEAWDARIRGSTTVAVIDTGVDATHPDLVANLLPGHDWVDGDDNPADQNGHGTHVAGTIAADRGNGIGVAGIADDAAKVMPLRVLDANGSGSVGNVIQAVAYAFQHGAKVVNLSLGSATYSQAEHDAIAAFPSMLFVAAAGNGGADGVGDDDDATPTFPCAYVLPNILCVAASDNRDQLASFSNYGARSVHLAAPGVSIASTWMGGGYSWASGTSMATPHVSGASALLWSASPGSLSTDVRSAILAGVDVKPAFQGKTVTGGRLNVLRSLRLVADVGVGEPVPVPPPGGDGGGTGGSGSSGGSASSGGGGSTGVNDAVPPRLSLRVRRHPGTPRLLARGLAVRLRCSERCTVRLVVRRRGRALTVPVRVTLASRSVSRRVVLRLNRAGRVRLHRHRAVPLTLIARAADTARNTRTLSVALRATR